MTLMRKSIALLAVLFLVALSTSPAGARTGAEGDLARRLDQRLQKSRVAAPRYGVAVLTREPKPKIVFARGHTRALRPASVAKVFTAAAALDLLGPGHVFETKVTARGSVSGAGVLQGDLVVHGAGDPNLSGRFYEGRPTYVLERFARLVRQAGIKRVTGSLVLDDGPFDRTFVHPSWSKADRGRWYGAPVAGLAYNDGCADVVVEGGSAAGVPAKIRVPSTVGDWQLENRVKTVARGRPTVGGIWVKKASTLRVQGTIAKGSRYPFSHPVPDPLRFFGGAFLRALSQAGVTVEGGMRPAQDAPDRRPGAQLLARHHSGLPATLEVMNRRSQNFYAALLFKTAGAANEGVGSWESGQRAIHTMLRRRGLDAEAKTRIVDGSGLSTDNRTTAATVVRLLCSFDEDLLRGPLLYESLAVPGQDGTLRRRLKDKDLADRLHAKTGTLGRSGVHALAGYLDGKPSRSGGRRHPGYAFAIFFDGVPGARSVIDDLVREIAKK